jgi:hypothetical protein
MRERNVIFVGGGIKQKLRKRGSEKCRIHNIVVRKYAKLWGKNRRKQAGECGKSRNKPWK